MIKIDMKNYKRVSFFKRYNIMVIVEEALTCLLFVLCLASTGIFLIMVDSLVKVL